MSAHFKRIKLINYIMTFDIYFRQLVTLAIKGKIGMPGDYLPPVDNEDISFSKKAM